MKINFTMNSLQPHKIYFLFFITCLLFSCSDDPKKQIDAQYGLYILGNDGKEYLLETDRLQDGLLKPEKNGVKLDGVDMDRDVIAKDGNFYHLNRKTAKFSKFTLTQTALKIKQQINMPGFSLENFNWISKDTLLLTGLNTSGYSEVKYFLIDTHKMEILKNGNLPIPKPVGKFKSISVGFLNQRDSAIFVGYTYNFPISISDYSTSDTIYVSQLKYPDMKLINTDKDIRSTYPGGENAVQTYSFTAANGDYYFMSCPGIALGNRPDLSTGIFRIKSGKNEIDKNYFFNISASKIDNHAYGMWYLGGNKVIIRSERKDLFTGLGDHYSVAHFEFYVLDLETKSITKLNLPLDKGTRRECVIVQGDTAYIAVNSTKEGNFIWLYNIKTGNLKKGLQLAGDTDFILRIDHLKD
ncbi:MAG: DUF4374 domain-containing protein [Pedobacter sp.]|nr:MAG: DUF4374 domain-containing protein [Pedobacter sp.]